MWHSAIFVAPIELKKKWDRGFTGKGAVVCRPCDKQGLGEDTDEETSSTGSGKSEYPISFVSSSLHLV